MVMQLLENKKINATVEWFPVTSLLDSAQCKSQVPLNDADIIRFNTTQLGELWRKKAEEMKKKWEEMKGNWKNGGGGGSKQSRSKRSSQRGRGGKGSSSRKQGRGGGGGGGWMSPQKGKEMMKEAFERKVKRDICADAEEGKQIFFCWRCIVQGLEDDPDYMGESGICAKEMHQKKDEKTEIDESHMRKHIRKGLKKNSMKKKRDKKDKKDKDKKSKKADREKKQRARKEKKEKNRREKEERKRKRKEGKGKGGKGKGGKGKGSKGGKGDKGNKDKGNKDDKETKTD